MEIKTTGYGRNSFNEMMDDLRSTFDSGKTLPLEFRLNQLKSFLRLIQENKEDFLNAVHKDLRKAKFEGMTAELLGVENDIKTAMREVEEWMKPEKMPFNLLLSFDSAFIHKEPYGVVLIIGAWNYPILLLLQPLVGAIVAGNCAIVKPSEHSPNTSAKIAELIPKYLDSNCYKVVEGDASATINLLEEKFDYIFATSSTTIGKSVMAAAAKHLTPVTLELGGKSPVYIDDSADFSLAAKRILWGKLINIGQTCIAPDYILCSKKAENAVVTEAKKILKDWYGEDSKSSPDIARIVNLNHFRRLCKVLEATKGKIVLGGQTDSEDKWIAPTMVVDVKESDSLMQEELFGPILPFLTSNSAEEALQFIKSRPKPLALYVFSKNQSVVDKFVEKSSSGSICCNDTVVQIGWEGMPFGGVGDSGVGNYHGRFSFDTFTHKKTVVIRSFNKIGEKLTEARYPPYNTTNMKAIVAALSNLRYFQLQPKKHAKYILTFALGVCTSFALNYYCQSRRAN